MTIKLKAGDYVTAANFRKAYEVGTARAYAASYGEDPELAQARALGNAHETAWTINSGTVITSDRAANLRAVALDNARKAAAPVLATGDKVEIEGEVFTVKIVGERFSDPIHFVR